MNIFIHTNSIRPYPLQTINSIRIITCNWIDNPEKFGIPNDIIIKVYNDHNKLQINNVPQLKNKLRVAYIQDANSDSELLNLLHVISLFNQLNSTVLSIYCNEEYAVILANYSNEHIQFIKKFADREKDVSIETDVIITYGPGIIHFLKQRIPVIIVGPYGLGGWITPDNFPYLLNSGFVGRAGGTLGEYIPIEILAHEILTIKEYKDLPTVLLANKVYADSLPYKPLSDTNEIIAVFTELQEKINHPQIRWQLYPFLASNILFEECGESVAIKRKHILDTLCTISKEDLIFFKSINGKTDCKTLFKISQMEENDFWQTIHSLMERKIILF